jgi:hypothetical protein
MFNAVYSKLSMRGTSTATVKIAQSVCMHKNSRTAEGVFIKILYLRDFMGN